MIHLLLNNLARTASALGAGFLTYGDKGENNR
jgi:hypothetical protein